MRDLTEVGLKFIEKWEELVLYVYDDKVPKRRIDGVLKYPEWDGSEVIGTLTIGYGHTDAAGWPKIKLGMRVTEQEADEILDADLKSCRQSVVNVAATQSLPLSDHQFDALVSFIFNCGPGNLRKMLTGLVAASYDSAVPRRLLQYTHSKGQYMQGLANRRAGEIQLWHMSEDPEEFESAPNPSDVEQAPPPKTVATSKAANTSIITGAIGGGLSLTQLTDTTGALKEAKGNLQELGFFDYLWSAASTPYFWVGLVLVLAGGYVYYDRHKKLTQEHV